MAVIGVGIDSTEIAYFANLLESDSASLRRIFGESELDSLGGEPHQRARRAAGHFCAKEAILKALGTGLSGGVAFTDIEILTGAHGEPLAVLLGHAAAVAESRGVRRWLISITYDGMYASAIAVAETGGGD